MYREIPGKVLKEQRPELQGASLCVWGWGVGMGVLGKGNSKGKGWEVGMSLACALRFPYSWSPGESEGKWMKVNRRGERARL